MFAWPSKAVAKLGFAGGFSFTSGGARRNMKTKRRAGMFCVHARACASSLGLQLVEEVYNAIAGEQASNKKLRVWDKNKLLLSHQQAE